MEIITWLNRWLLVLFKRLNEPHVINQLSNEIISIFSFKNMLFYFNEHFASKNPVVESKSDKTRSSAPIALARPNSFLFSPGVAHDGKLSIL